MAEPATFTDLVLDRLGDAGLDEAAQDLVLAAVQGLDELADAVEALIGTGAQRVTRPAVGGPAVATAATGVFLRSVTVAAFRGIGEAATLPLSAGPGLTVVAGRNGSGKSSFAEAAELALTGGVGRWTNAARAAGSGWRNLHASCATEVSVVLDAAGTDRPTTVSRSWAPGAALADGTDTRQVSGRPRTPVDAAGWGPALTTYRPFLSPTELGALADDRPSAMFDAVRAILGLEQLTEAEDRLKVAGRDVDEQAGQAKRELPQLRAVLARSEDARAGEVDALLSRRGRDLDRIGALATGTAGDGDDERLAALTSLTGPDADAEDQAAELREATGALDRLQGSAALDAGRLADLIGAALDHHGEHGDGPCPVCGSGALDAEWQAGAVEQRSHLLTTAREAEAVTRRQHAALAAVRALFGPVPAAVTGAPIDGVALVEVATAWQAWAALADEPDPRALADGVDAVAPILRSAVAKVHVAAAAERAARDAGWREIAELVATWVNAARTAEAFAPAAAALKAASAWLRSTGETLRADRLRPFAEESARIWAQLRQESSVELAGIRLDGAATRRRLTLDVSVDGVASAALGVMSQGEFNALGLALFLPRATADASPFRFVVLDDPVQAMDPAKVDGLARVLAELAATRQVVVFSHDDRLPESLRRLRLPATVVEVVRSGRSAISVESVDDPVSAHLQDARALALTTELPDDLRSVGVAGCCRDAFEAACLEVVRRNRIGRGVPHEEVDRAWSGTTTMQRAALALFDDVERSGDVLSRLRRSGPWAADCLVLLKRGAHVHVSSTPLVSDTETLVAEVRRA